VLVDAAKNAALLTRDKGLGSEVIDAVIEATLDESGVHLQGKKVLLAGVRCNLQCVASRKVPRWKSMAIFGSGCI
jgi:chloramphenicol 3-O-phosphotransferase